MLAKIKTNSQSEFRKIKNTSLQTLTNMRNKAHVTIINLIFQISHSKKKIYCHTHAVIVPLGAQGSDLQLA